MLLQQIIYLIVLFPLLWMHVEAQKDFETLLGENKLISNPTTEDEMEFNEMLGQLDAAKDKSDADKMVAARSFEVYLQERQFYKDTINKFLKPVPVVPKDLEDLLNMALTDRNYVKGAAIEQAFMAIATLPSGSNMPQIPNMQTGMISIKDMQSLLQLLNSADFLSRLLSSGGTVLSPSITQLYTGYNPIPPSQQHTTTNDNKKVKDLLQAILNKVEVLTKDDDDDIFDWFHWLK